MSDPQAPPVRFFRSSEVASWCLYDWANSAFITSITVVLLPLYFSTLFVDPKSVRIDLGLFDWRTSAESIWLYANSLSMLLLILVAPVLGAMADLSGGKKRFLAFCALIGGAATVSLAAPGPGAFLLVAGIYVVAYTLWGAGNVFYDGFLPEIGGTPAAMDAISAAGYGVGYLGGAIMLGIDFWLLSGVAHAGPAAVSGAFRLGFVLVGLWWALFTIPLLLFVSERGRNDGRARLGLRLVAAGAARLRGTLRKVGRLPEMVKLLVSFFLYNSGVGTIIIVAAIYAKTDVGLSQKTIFIGFLVVQVVGFPAAFLYIALARKLGTKVSVIAGILVYVVVTILAIHMRSASEFYALAVLIALVQGGVQAMSRSLYGALIPEGMSAEFYGFFSIFNKVGPFAGPLLFGVVRDATGSPKAAILFLLVFFLAGLVSLLFVRMDRGREQAAAFHAGETRG